MKARKTKRGKICRMCGDKKALYLYRGRARVEKHHDLCPRCWQRLVNQVLCRTFVQGKNLRIKTI